MFFMTGLKFWIFNVWRLTADFALSLRFFLFNLVTDMALLLKGGAKLTSKRVFPKFFIQFLTAFQGCFRAHNPGRISVLFASKPSRLSPTSWKSFIFCAFYGKTIIAERDAWFWTGRHGQETIYFEHHPRGVSAVWLSSIGDARNGKSVDTYRQIRWWGRSASV